VRAAKVRADAIIFATSAGQSVFFGFFRPVPFKKRRRQKNLGIPNRYTGISESAVQVSEVKSCFNDG